MGKNILLIDDSEYILTGLQFVLSKKGFNIQIAEDGIKGLEAIKTMPFDLVLTDLFMPNMDGFDLTRAIRQLPEHKNTPVIAYTGYVDEKHLNQAREAGITKILNKPLNVDEVLVQLNEYLG